MNSGEYCQSAHPRKKCFQSGTNDANILPEIGALHTLWHRQHNRVADRLKVIFFLELNFFFYFLTNFRNLTNIGQMKKYLKKQEKLLSHKFNILHIMNFCQFLLEINLFSMFYSVLLIY